jgi:hypothetical protein
MKALKREVQVAFSPRAQPWWFRLLKWSLFTIMTVRYRERWWFRYLAGAALAGGIGLHLFYRWKTHGWRRAWGGWSDIPPEGDPAEPAPSGAQEIGYTPRVARSHEQGERS